MFVDCMCGFLLCLKGNMICFSVMFLYKVDVILEVYLWFRIEILKLCVILVKWKIFIVIRYLKENYKKNRKFYNFKKFKDSFI